MNFVIKHTKSKDFIINTNLWSQPQRPSWWLPILLWQFSRDYLFDYTLDLSRLFDCQSGKQKLFYATCLHDIPTVSSVELCVSYVLLYGATPTGRMLFFYRQLICSLAIDDHLLTFSYICTNNNLEDDI